MINHYIYTDRECEECHKRIVYDPHRAEYYCLNCGLIPEEEGGPNEDNKNQ